MFLKVRLAPVIFLCLFNTLQAGIFDNFSGELDQFKEQVLRVVGSINIFTAIDFANQGYVDYGYNFDNYTYLGTWTATEGYNKSQYNFFNSNGGKIRMWINVNETNFGVAIRQYEDQYIDGRVTDLGFSLQNTGKFIDVVSQNWTLGYGLEENFMLLQDLGDITWCNVQLQMKAYNKITGTTPKNNDSNLDISYALQLKGNNCTMSFTANFDVDTTIYKLRTGVYASMVFVIVLVQLFALFKMYKKCSEDEAEAKKLSLMSFCLLTIADGCLFLFHLYLTFSHALYFYIFLVPAFFYFVALSVYESRLIHLLWKVRYYDTYQNENRRKLGIAFFYLRFIIGMLVIFVIMFMYFMIDWVVLVGHLYLLPQLIHNATQGDAFRFDVPYIFGLSFLRILIPLYFRGCPSNVFETTPSLEFSIILPILLFIQIGFYYLQWLYGSRFFIPKCFLPRKYDYFVRIAEDCECQEDDCPICMNPLLRAEDEEGPSIFQRILRNRNQQYAVKMFKLMQTPCGHKFHVACLKQWMGFRMVCPTCRFDLPAL